nr:arylesterase [Nitratireductor basaltis]
MLLLVAVFAAFCTAARAEPVRIVALGDSLMAGYQLPPGESVPDRLEEALRANGYDVEVANAGVSGDTTSGGLSRLDWSVPQEADLVIVELGANDMLRGITPEATRKNLAQIIDRLKTRGQIVLLAGMYAAPNLGADYQERFNAIFPNLAEEKQVALMPFYMEGVAAERDLLLSDGMHPNEKGVARIVENLLPHVEELLDQQAADNSEPNEKQLAQPTEE